MRLKTYTKCMSQTIRTVSLVLNHKIPLPAEFLKIEK